MALAEHFHDRRAWADMGPDGDRYAADRAAWAGGPAPLTARQTLVKLTLAHAWHLVDARQATTPMLQHRALNAAAGTRQILASTPRLQFGVRSWAEAIRREQAPMRRAA